MPNNSKTVAKRNTPQISAIHACHNQYSGAVFIVASGASAKDFPIEEFAHIPMITMNGAIATLLESKINPLFYICTDSSFPLQQDQLFNSAMQHANNVVLHRKYFKCLPQTCGKLFLIDKAKAPSLLDRVRLTHKNPSYSLSIFSQRKSSFGFSKNLSDGWVDCRTVAYTALQLAYHLGFNTVIMVGFDLNTCQPRFYEHQDRGKSPIGLDKHYEKRILPCLKFMHKNIVCQNFNVFNLSHSSKVPHEIIPKISINTLRIMLESTQRIEHSPTNRR